MHSRLAALVAVMVLIMGTTAAAQAPQKLDDDDIAIAIENELYFDDSVSAHLVDVSTDEGVVTLTGYVDSLLARDRAVDIARSIKGVRSVIDRIEVRTPRRSEGEIRAEVEQALVEDPATDSYEIDVMVDDGVVTLEGTVNSFAERRLAAQVAKGVRGVRDVVEDLEIEYETARSDSAIKADVRRSLESSVWVDDALIDIEVDDGVVRLTGTVGSALERQRATWDAWVVGVESVDSSRLQVRWWARDEMRRKQRYAARNDRQIESAVEMALRRDPRVSEFDVEVSSEDGIVSLRGKVDNLAARNAAEADAENTIGVRRVRNHLAVRPVTMQDDAEVEQRIRNAFRRDAYVNRYDVTVSVINAQAYLAGNVNTSFEKHRAETLASRVKGVIDVRNNIEYEHTWTWKPDWQIAEDVEAQFFWSPFVDGDDINVTVDNGVVTLTGKVDTWSEWRDAAENAFEGGAKDVLNRLEVTFG